MTVTKSSNTVLTMLGSQEPPFVPEGVEAMTVRLDLPPGDPGSPPHRHSGPVFGYANNLADRWSRFLVVMLCAPGQEMLVYVDDEELEQRRDRRAPRPVS